MGCAHISKVQSANYDAHVVTNDGFSIAHNQTRMRPRVQQGRRHPFVILYGINQYEWNPDICCMLPFGIWRRALYTFR